MTSCQSSSADASPLSPSISTTPSIADKDFSLSASSKAIQSSLKLFNDYIQKHYERFAEHESLERTRLVASFTQKERSYERQISTLKTIHTDIAGLLAREQLTSSELRQKLDTATNSINKLCRAVADANFVFVKPKEAPHGIKQEDDLEESVNVSDIKMCPNAAISSLLSQIETVAIKINAQNGVNLPPSPCHSVIEALDKVANSLLVTQRSFALLLKDFKSVDAARAGTECQNRSLQQNVALLQEELKRTRSDNQRISRELAAARLEREKHTCRPPPPIYPTPATEDDFPTSLPSPPLEKQDLPTPDDVLHDTSKISRRTTQTPATRTLPENTTTPPPTPTINAGLSSASTSINGGRRRMSVGEAIKRVKTMSISSTAQSAPLDSPIPRDEQQTAGRSMPPPPTPAQGVKRASSSVFDCQDNSNAPRTPSSTSALATPSTSEKTAAHRPLKKRRINGPSLKNRPTSEAPAINTNTAHASTSATSPKHNTAQLPQTKASDLKSLKFNKVSRVSKPPSTPAPAASPNISTPKKFGGPSMRPLELAKKSPQERAALRRAR